MKIIQIMPEFGLAGAEIMCENLTYELKKLGHTVIVISMYDYHSAITDRMENAGVEVKYLGKKKGLDLSMIWKMKKIFRQTKADVIHTHRNCAQYAIPAAILSGVKCRVHTVHSVAQKENSKLARKLNKFFFKHCHLIPVALSEAVKESIADEYKISRENIPVVFNGIDLSKCIPKQDYKINGAFKILHIGRFASVKNHKGLIEAFYLFHQKHQDSELWLIGDGENKHEIQNYVKEKKLESCVSFLGLQSNVYNYLNCADVFSLPSIYEGIPMTLIEAMGTGLPIVATAVGGVPDMLDNSSALLVPVDVVLIAEAFEKYYFDKNLREHNGVISLEKSRQFSVVKMGKSYELIYEQKRV